MSVNLRLEENFLSLLKIYLLVMLRYQQNVLMKFLRSLMIYCIERSSFFIVNIINVFSTSAFVTSLKLNKL